MSFTRSLSPYLLSVLRIVTGLIFMEHGTGKWIGFPPNAMGYPASFGQVTSNFFSGASAGLFELIGGALIVLGLFTRPVAFVLSGVMAFAFFLGHFKLGAGSFFPVLNGGDAAVLYCFVFLYLCAAGGGPLSLDRILGLSKD